MVKGIRKHGPDLFRVMQERLYQIQEWAHTAEGLGPEEFLDLADNGSPALKKIVRGSNGYPQDEFVRYVFPIDDQDSLYSKLPRRR